MRAARPRTIFAPQRAANRNAHIMVAWILFIMKCVGNALLAAESAAGSAYLHRQRSRRQVSLLAPSAESAAGELTCTVSRVGGRCQKEGTARTLSSCGQPAGLPMSLDRVARCHERLLGLLAV
jgi:hypothetical protein